MASLSGTQSYRLTIRRRADGSSQIALEAASPEGAEHAKGTLAQLRVQYGTRLPCCSIDDSPAFPTRGVMLDISRDRIPTMEHLFEIVDHLAALKFNHLQLYTEHTFAYRGHEEVWQGWDPIVPAECRELDTYCRAHGIELAANQNCFGHLASWLRHPRYAPLAETLGEWVFEHNGERFPRSGPFSLCPTDPRSLELVRDLLDQLLPCFSSALVNIGCDETFDVGYGRSADAVRERGRTAVCVDFLRRICDLARSHGKRPQFWADIALHDPAAARGLGDAIALVWDYEPGYSWSESCAKLRQSGREVWVCPGTSAWRSITGRTTERRANLHESALQGMAGGASAFMVTEWGDTGHHQQWPVTLHALAEAADAAWTGGRPGYDTAAASLHVFGDCSLGLAGWIDELGDADLPLRMTAGRVREDGQPCRLRNSTALFVDLHMPLADSPGVDARVRRGMMSTPIELWAQTRARLRSLEADPRWRAVPAYEAELRHTLAVAVIACERALLRRRTARASPATLAALADALDPETADHRRLWLSRSRPGGLDSSTRHYRRVIDDLRGDAA